MLFTRFAKRINIKKKLGFSALGELIEKKGKHMTKKGKKIGYSDIPESTDAELKKARRVGRPKSDNAKHLIAIRIDPRLIADLKKLAKKNDIPYQTLIHRLLEDAVEDAA